MPASTSIGQRFTQLIQHLGLSKNAFAQSLDKTATVIQHLVDERNKPGYDLLCKVFEVYPNVSKDWLMEGAGSMLKPVASPDEVATAPLTVAAPQQPEADLFGASTPPAEAPAPLVAPTVPIPAPVAAAAKPPLVVAEQSLVAPPVVAPLPAAPAPDPAYLTAALQTQYLQHQLALAEQRNQHLLEQQALMQQLVAVLQRSVG
jgi:hypothetical protein